MFGIHLHMWGTDCRKSQAHNIRSSAVTGAGVTSTCRTMDLFTSVPAENSVSNAAAEMLIRVFSLSCLDFVTLPVSANLPGSLINLPAAFRTIYHAFQTVSCDTNFKMEN